MKKLFLASTLLVANAFTSFADVELKQLIPTVGGVMRTRFEIQTVDGRNRFAVNNARVWVKGNIIPRLSYFVCTDLCNQGKFQFLDAYGRFDVGKGVAIQAGQFRIPFGVDPFRGPGSYIFADRSFIGRDIDNIRAVGAQASYTLQKEVPACFTVGVFSPNEITDHNKWSKTLNYAFKAEIPVSKFKITGGLQTLKPDIVRMNMADATVFFSDGRWSAEVEYMYKHYLGYDFPDNHSYNVWVDYKIPLRKTIFDRLSFQGRFDGSTAHSDGIPQDGKLIENFPSRKRLTLGTTLDYVKKPLKCEIQLNYEKFFYPAHYAAPVGRNDKIVAELIISF